MRDEREASDLKAIISVPLVRVSSQDYLPGIPIGISETDVQLSVSVLQRETTQAAPPNDDGGDAEKHPHSAQSADRGGAQKRPSVERRKVQRMQALLR